ncbi:phosphomethylpyrimidine synthase ThiC [Paraglaciecola arctica]|uniref:phosphomethylpyrimidine synthase ThiC n=1 Tax=Paraglaciecola arctica TaxID=1128911 RepID=UPI001C06644A|nr:phosphomethylpyrimidine synthase ThiC [Paraglaciecola arctica]MBU3004274.1 phosphomethylpyrimidine synthase ThiC [Paraglaciecola arctica]
MNEIDLQLLEKEEAERLISNGQAVRLNSRNKSPTLIGDSCLVKVNVSIGVSDNKKIDIELEKVSTLTSLKRESPDIIMDLTITDDYSVVDCLLESFNGPIGTLPHYRVPSKFTPKEYDRALLKHSELLASKGVSFFTIHPTANLDLARIASSTRKTPITSRGGGILLKHTLLHNCSNPFERILPEFVEMCKSYGVAISVGSSFRPSSNNDALDDVHLKEIALQTQYIQKIKSLGGTVFFECLGHADLNQLDTYSQIIKDVGVPMMALGPITTDMAAGFDHITNAIGASYLAHKGGCHVINSVTREEHTGKVPNIDSIVEGLKTAKIVAHSVNIAKFPIYKSIFEKNIYDQRAEKQSCVVDSGLFDEVQRERVGKGCSRCGAQCPLILTQKIKNHV